MTLDFQEAPVSSTLSLRREFLEIAGATAAVPLIATAMATGANQLTRVAALKSSAKSEQ
jgi:hypothetical protein